MAYEPNSLGGGCPFQMGARGFTSFPEPIAADKVRGKPEKFADHYSQATLFWNSQTPYEKAHIIRGFRFELTKVQVPAIRERTVSMLRNVSDELAKPVADGLGLELPRPMPRVMEPPKPEVRRPRPCPSRRGRATAASVGVGSPFSWRPGWMGSRWRRRRKP